MASLNKLASGKWRVQLRIKGHYLSDSFLVRKDAEMWARRIEREIDLGQKSASKHKNGIKTFADLIDLHIADMAEVGKRMGRSKSFGLDLLRNRLDELETALEAFEERPLSFDAEEIVRAGTFISIAGDGRLRFDGRYLATAPECDQRGAPCLLKHAGERVTQALVGRAAMALRMVREPAHTRAQMISCRIKLAASGGDGKSCSEAACVKDIAFS